jgi:SAM-dependent methyltransferase
MYAISGKLRRFKKTYRTANRLNNLNTASFWNKKTKADQSLLLNSQIYKNKLRIILNFLKNKKGKILDIGFGSGYLETMIIKHKYKLSLCGIDISPVVVNKAQRTLLGEYKVSGISKIPYKNCFFDIVLALDVIEHIQDSKTMNSYIEMNRVLKRNGILIISIPLNEGLEEMIKHGENPNGHMRDYTPTILKAELGLFGYKILSEYYLYAFRNSYWIKSFLLHLLPFKVKEPNLMIVFAQK